MGVVNPTVDDGDLDALARVAGSTSSLPGVRGADVGNTRGVAARMHGNGLHALDPVDALDVGHLSAIYRHSQAVVGGLQAVFNRAS